MRSGLTIGRLFGIRINIDWSWLLIFLLVTWNLGAAFGNIHPEWGEVLRWGIAVSASLLFFLSVLAHEMAHSLVARAQGVPVKSITLFLFGGVSNIQREPPSPRDEFFITVVGPITSIIIGLVVTTAGSALTSQVTDITLGDPEALASQLSPLATILLWLGPINIVIGLFNLVPGFPLDGGRLLRSALWAVTDDLRRATRWATWIGQGVGWLIIIAGIAMVFGFTLPFFGTGLGGLWLAFIGWFLSTAASQSYRKVVINDILEDVPVSHLMLKNPPTISGASSVSSLVYDYMMGTDEHAFPVTQDDQMIGLVTLNDIRKVPRDDWETLPVRNIMTPLDQLSTLSPDEEADDALNELQRRDVRQLPVLDNGQISGLLRRRDILKWLQIQNAN